MSAAITRHGQPFEPTYPDPQTDEEKRVWIAEARAYHASGYMKAENAPLPELYAGHYNDLLGVDRVEP